MHITGKFSLHMLLAALGLIVYQQAQAARIEPAGSEFTAQGPISFAKSIINADCTIQVSGKIDSSGQFVSVDKVAFDGGFKCGQVSARDLPWKLIAKDASSGSMSGISVHVAAPFVGGDCGPSTADGTWNNATGKLQAANVAIDGGCTIKHVSIQMPPTFKVVE